MPWLSVARAALEGKGVPTLTNESPWHVEAVRFASKSARDRAALYLKRSESLSQMAAAEPFNRRRKQLLELAQQYETMANSIGSRTEHRNRARLNRSP